MSLHPDVFTAIKAQLQERDAVTARRVQLVVLLLDACGAVLKSTQLREAEELALSDALDVIAAVHERLNVELREAAQRRARELLERGS